MSEKKTAAAPAAAKSNNTESFYAIRTRGNRSTVFGPVETAEAATAAAQRGALNGDRIDIVRGAVVSSATLQIALTPNSAA